MNFKVKKITIGNCDLYRGLAEEILPSIGAVDCMITDPPYDFKTSGGGKMRKERKCLEDIISNGLDKGFDYTIINPLLYQSVFVFCHNDQLHKLLPYIAGSYNRHTVLFWEKKNPMPVANKHYLPNIEPYIHAWNKGYHPVGDLVDKKRTILTNNGKSEYDHPTVKPIAVMDKIVRNMNGDSVVDPFMGTGSTGVSAVRNGKRFVGIEKNEKYFNIAVKRITKTVDESKSPE